MSKTDSKVYMERQKTRIANTILKKSKIGELMLLNFKTYYKTIVIKTVWNRQKNTNRSMEQNRESQNRTA